MLREDKEISNAEVLIPILQQDIKNNRGPGPS